MARALSDVISCQTLVDGNLRIAVVYQLPRANFARLAQFYFTVDAHIAIRDQNFSGAAAGAKANEF